MLGLKWKEGLLHRNNSRRVLIGCLGSPEVVESMKIFFIAAPRVRVFLIDVRPVSASRSVSTSESRRSSSSREVHPSKDVAPRSPDRVFVFGFSERPAILASLNAVIGAVKSTSTRLTMEFNSRCSSAWTSPAVPRDVIRGLFEILKRLRSLLREVHCAGAIKIFPQRNL